MSPICGSRSASCHGFLAASATELLQLAPGIYLSSEGGEGHAERIYLRGFDAREGQDIELSVGGVPINESGNFHGNGFADTGFIIPELVTGPASTGRAVRRAARATTPWPAAPTTKRGCQSAV